MNLIIGVLCCIFRPAFGCCALQTLVEIVIFSAFIQLFYSLKLLGNGSWTFTTLSRIFALSELSCVLVTNENMGLCLYIFLPSLSFSLSIFLLFSKTRRKQLPDPKNSFFAWVCFRLFHFKFGRSNFPVNAH